MTVEVRDAEEADLPATLEIFNELIETTTIAWTERRQTLDERRAWFAEQQRRGFATLVAVEDGAVVGGASYGDFRDSVRWPGYRYTAELTIHVRGDRRRSGIGRLLMEELFARCRGAGLRVLVAGIDSENTDSLRFHERLGFFEVARMPGVGHKFGRRLDLVLLQRAIESPRTGI